MCHVMLYDICLEQNMLYSMSHVMLSCHFMLYNICHVMLYDMFRTEHVSCYVI